jgi:hypothetical protein
MAQHRDGSNEEAEQEEEDVSYVSQYVFHFVMIQRGSTTAITPIKNQ